MRSYLVLIIILAIAAVGGFAVYQKFGQPVITDQFVGTEPVAPDGNLDKVPLVNGVPDYSEVGPVADAVQRERPIIISYTDSGFSPNKIIVRPGAVISFLNQSSRPMWVASDLHPSHKLLPGFDQLKSIGQQGSYNYTFIKSGSWGYHNHINPADGGVIGVK